MEIAKNCVVALGYFDGVHLGHREVVRAAAKQAAALGAPCCALTFGGDLGGLFGKSGGSIYTTAERGKLLKEDCGADFVCFAPCTREFFSLKREEFLDWLEAELSPVGYACGFDYTFGAGGEGDAAYLQSEAEKRGKAFVKTPPFSVNGQKVSATRIKELLKSGRIEEANALLTRSYFVSGRVIRERGVGRQMGFPTVNLYPPAEKLPLKNAVYGGHAAVGGKTYRAIVNYGARPTFSLENPLVEAHLIGFEGDLYGKEMEIFFDFFLRDIRRFGGMEELKAQLAKDREEVINR